MKLSMSLGLKFLLVLVTGFCGFAMRVQADNSPAGSQTLIISVNKTVPLAEAEAYAQKLERVDPTTGTCYLQVRVTQYIPYPSCTDDASCPYWGVALTDLSWQCKEPLKTWVDELSKNSNYTIYSNGRIGPLPVVSGGN